LIKLLANIYIKETDSPKQQRQKYGILCGALGIALNILLFAGKFFAGVISKSVAITADAFNNLSDAGSSAITLVGFKLAGQKPDAEHPFGHGRIEYLSGLAVSVAILFMGFELAKSSVSKIIHPQAVQFSILSCAILAVSVAVKLYMSAYNKKIGNQIDSAAMRATASDSLSDSIATAVVLVASVVGHYTGIKIDGWCGLLVSFFIFKAGWEAAKETISPLDLKGERLMTLSQGSGTATLVTQICADAGFTHDLFLQTDDEYSMLNFVEEGLGIALLPKRILRPLFSESVVLKSIADKKTRSTVLCYNKNKYQTKAVRLFASSLLAIARDEEKKD